MTRREFFKMTLAVIATGVILRHMPKATHTLQGQENKGWQFPWRFDPPAEIYLPMVVRD